MSNQGSYPPNRVPQGIEAANQLIKGRDTIDILILVILPSGITGFLFYINFLTGQGFIYTIGAIFGLNYILFTFIPTEESIIYWVSSFVSYHRKEKSILKNGLDKEDIDDDLELKDDTASRDPTESSSFDFLKTSQNTQDLTGIEAIDTHNDVVQLANGGYVAGIHVKGMERMLAGDQIVAKTEEEFKSFLNAQDFKIIAGCTSEQFDFDSELERYSDRLEDKDIKNRPIMERHVRTKRAFMEQQIKPLGMNHKQFYVLVTVTPSEQELDGTGPFDIDFIDPNSMVGKWLRNRSNSNDDVKTQDEVLIDMVKQRRKTVKRGLARIRQVQTDEMTGKDLAYQLQKETTRNDINLDDWEPSIPVAMSKEQIENGEFNA